MGKPVRVQGEIPVAPLLKIAPQSNGGCANSDETKSSRSGRTTVSNRPDVSSVKAEESPTGERLSEEEGRGSLGGGGALATLGGPAPSPRKGGVGGLNCTYSLPSGQEEKTPGALDVVGGDQGGGKVGSARSPPGNGQPLSNGSNGDSPFKRISAG